MKYGSVKSTAAVTKIRGDQGQGGWGSEQPDPVEGVPAHDRGVGTR